MIHLSRLNLTILLTLPLIYKPLQLVDIIRVNGFILFSVYVKNDITFVCSSSLFNFRFSKFMLIILIENNLCPRISPKFMLKSLTFTLYTLIRGGLALPFLKTSAPEVH